VVLAESFETVFAYHSPMIKDLLLTMVIDLSWPIKRYKSITKSEDDQLYQSRIHVKHMLWCTYPGNDCWRRHTSMLAYTRMNDNRLEILSLLIFSRPPPFWKRNVAHGQIRILGFLSPPELDHELHGPWTISRDPLSSHQKHAVMTIILLTFDSPCCVLARRCDARSSSIPKPRVFSPIITQFGRFVRVLHI